MIHDSKKSEIVEIANFSEFTENTALQVSVNLLQICCAITHELCSTCNVIGTRNQSIPMKKLTGNRVPVIT